MRADDIVETSFPPSLKTVLEGRVCVLGVGNRDRSDDAAGSLLAERLAKVGDGLSIDAGTVPENYLEKLVSLHPDTVLIIDAADFGGIPGEVRLLDPEQVGPSTMSTHALSLQMTGDYLKARAGARVALLAIQPADIRWGTELSKPVSHAVERLYATLSAALETGGRDRGKPGSAPARPRGLNRC